VPERRIISICGFFGVEELPRGKPEFGPGLVAPLAGGGMVVRSAPCHRDADVAGLCPVGVRRNSPDSEMNHPLPGFIKVSSAPMVKALERLGK